MKLQDAMSIIDKKEVGFMVSFEKRVGGVLHSDHFPDKHAGEDLIQTETEAWELANRFAKSTGDNYVNIYVVNHNFYPVAGYGNKKIKAY